MTLIPEKVIFRESFRQFASTHAKTSPHHSQIPARNNFIRHLHLKPTQSDPHPKIIFSKSSREDNFLIETISKTTSFYAM